MPNLELGKYAIYIWPSYIATVVVIGALAVDSVLRARRWKREADRREAEKKSK